MKMNLSIKTLILITVFATVLSLTACGKKEPATTAPPADNSVVVTTATAKTGDINAVATVTGKIAPQDQVNIQPKSPGKVGEVLVDIGSVVKKGQVVMKMDARELAQGIKQAEAGYAVAQANYYKTKVGARPEQKEQSKANLAQAEASYKKNLTDLERMKELFNEGAISQQALDGQKVAFAAADAAYKSAKGTLDIMIKGETSETFKIMQAQMDQAKAQLDLQKINYDNAVITSPINGIIGIRNVNPGEISPGGSPSLTIINIDNVRVEANVTESQVNKLMVGEEVKLGVSAASSKGFTGKIKSVSPMANPQNKMYLVKITIANVDHALKPGMFAEIALPVEQKQSVLLVPREAVVEVGGEKGVYVVNAQGNAEFKKVDVGVSDGTSTEVLGGIEKAVTVITSGQQNLQNGIKVRIEGKL